MLKVRVIPVVLSDRQRVVKGSGFDNWRVVGTLPQVLNLYSARDVDEMVVIDVRASRDQGRIDPALMAEVVARCAVPVAVGGGISDGLAAVEVIAHGADKAILGSAAHENPSAVEEAVQLLGSQSVVGAVDVVGDRDSGWATVCRGASRQLNESPADTARRLADLGVGEILLTSVTQDGTLGGYDWPLLETVRSAVDVPLLVCGGAGSISDLVSAVVDYGSDGVCAGSLFQFTEVTPAEVRRHLESRGVPVRMTRALDVP